MYCIKGCSVYKTLCPTIIIKVYNQYDPIFKEAYRLINSPDYDKKLSAPN